MKIFNWYMFKNLAIATIFVSVILAVVIFLTQSLRFLELVVDSGASSASFWILTALALPRFFEIIMPLSLMAAILFIYNRMIMDSELIAIRSVGYSPASLAKPAIVLALCVTIFLWSITMWVAPKSLSGMKEMRRVIKAQFSVLFFREGVFNQVGDGLTIYIRERASNGDLKGLMIHDSRDKSKPPSTVLAKRGVYVASLDGQQVLVYNGTRQEYVTETNSLRRLDFERYTIELPDSEPVRQRWQGPDERTIFELVSPNMNNERDAKSIREFQIEIHRRIAGPLLALSFALVSCCLLLLGPLDRRGQGRRIAAAILCAVVIEGLFIGIFNITQYHNWALIVMYVIVLAPIAASLFFLSPYGEHFRRSLLYKKQRSHNLAKRLAEGGQV